MTTQAALAGNRPLYLQARDAIAARISKGEWPVGAYIPSENDLARELKVSSGTMRKALDFLEGEMLVSRVQGRGTMVLAERPVPGCPECGQALNMLTVAAGRAARAAKAALAATRSGDLEDARRLHQQATALLDRAEMANAAMAAQVGHRQAHGVHGKNGSG